MLIHAVGPRWRGGSHNEEHLLKKTIFRCLELTEKHNYSSIAIPALSAGFYGYPAVESVEAVLGAIELYIKTVPSSIKEIYFCDVNDTIVKKFVKCLKKNFGLEVKEFKGDELGSLLMIFLSAALIFIANYFLYKIKFTLTIFLLFT